MLARGLLSCQTKHPPAGFIQRIDMTLDEFIERLQSLREFTPGETPVCIQTDDGESGDSLPTFEIAMAEVQNVMQPTEVDGDLSWTTTYDQNTEQIISIV